MPLPIVLEIRFPLQGDGFRVAGPSTWGIRLASELSSAHPPAPPPPEPPPVESASFCDTHPCIDNFDEGNGYPVQCNDGMWSQSGGIQGACSYHGGVRG